MTVDESQDKRGLPAVQVRAATKVYNHGAEDEVVALQDIDLDVPEGEVVALLGPSGCGKSTLLNMVGGLVTTTEGEIRVAGSLVTDPSPAIGMMFQRPVLLPWLKVIDNVLLPLKVQGAESEHSQDKANSLIELVGLAGFAERYPSELSGGMQQRVAICRMLIAEPQVLLLDEPFGALDELTREFMDVELRQIITSQGRSAILVTHSPLEAVFMADRVDVMTPRPGRVAGRVEIELGADRSSDLFASDELIAYVRKVRDLIEDAHAEEESAGE